MNFNLTAIFLLLFATLGCVHVPLSRKARLAKPLPQSIADQVSYDKSVLKTLTKMCMESNSTHIVYHVALEVATKFGTNDILRGKLFVPNWACETNSASVILILPVSAGKTYPLEHNLARYYVKKGYACFLVYREKEPKRITDSEIMNRLLLQSILNNRQAVDWVETQPELDRRNIAVLGTSMGAIKAVMLTAVEPRISACLSALGGGNLPEILSETKDGAWRGRGIVRKRTLYLAEEDMTKKELREKLSRELLWDPAKMAEYIDPKKMFMVYGTCDNVVPTRTERTLWRALGRPSKYVYFGGHYGAVFYLWHIKYLGREFFDSHQNK